jgi:hypothetical protein
MAKCRQRTQHNSLETLQRLVHPAFWDLRYTLVLPLHTTWLHSYSEADANYHLPCNACIRIAMSYSCWLPTLQRLLLEGTDTLRGICHCSNFSNPTSQIELYGAYVDPQLQQRNLLA